MTKWNKAEYFCLKTMQSNFIQKQYGKSCRQSSTDTNISCRKNYSLSKDNIMNSKEDIKQTKNGLYTHGKRNV
jgi:hypothetical protein